MKDSIKLLFFLTILLSLTSCSEKKAAVPAFPGNMTEIETKAWLNKLCSKYGGMTQIVGTKKLQTHIQVSSLEYQNMIIDLFVENSVNGEVKTDKVTITVPLQTLLKEDSNVFRPLSTDKYMLKLKSMYPNAITHSFNDKSGKLPEFKIPFYEREAAIAFQEAIFYVKDLKEM